MGKKKSNILVSILKLVIIVQCVTIIIVSMFITDVKLYVSLTPNARTGFDVGMRFIETYTRTTGDTTLALNKGVSEDTAKKWAENEDKINISLDSSYKVSGDLSNLNLDEKYKVLTGAASDGNLHNTTYYKQRLKKVTIDGHDYVFEQQGGVEGDVGWGNYCINEEKKWVSVSQAGCFMYATAAAVGAIKEDVYTVEDLFNQTPKGIVVYGEDGMFNVVSEQNRNVRLEDYGDCCGTPDRLKLFLSGAGVTATVTNIDSNRVARMKEGLSKGYVYVIYATADASSSRELYTYTDGGFNSHWTCVVANVQQQAGGTTEEKFVVLCNAYWEGGGGRSMFVSPDQFANLACCYEIIPEGR